MVLCEQCRNAPRSRKTGTCRACERPDRKLAAYGWCDSCYHRWDRNGRPAAGPGRPKFTRDMDGKLEDTRFLLAAGITSPHEIARRIGVHVWTARRYIKIATALDVDAVMAMLYPDEAS